MSDHVIFNAIPASGKAIGESPLVNSRARVDVVSSVAEAGVIVSERAFLGHLILRGNADTDGFAAAVHNATGVSLPTQPCQLSLGADAASSIQWMSPDEWLIIVPGNETFGTEQRLRERLQGHYAVINVSGGQTVLELQGPGVRELLMKCSPYDVHPRNFPVGKGVSTVFAKAGAVIRHIEEDHWEIVIRRSFADYLFNWIVDAGESLGVYVANAGER